MEEIGVESVAFLPSLMRSCTRSNLALVFA